MKLFPVVHVSSVGQALEQAKIAYESDSDGVYLIQHMGRKGLLDDALAQVVHEFPDNYIGVNYLGAKNAVGAYRHIARLLNEGLVDRLPDAIWVDDAESEKQMFRQLEAERDIMPELRDVRLLGGVCFKYTNGYTDDPLVATAHVNYYGREIDVVTTSGEGTGHAPSVDKIKAMKLVLGDRQLAVASGVDIHNVSSYEGYLDEVLVASSVETHPYSGKFVPEKIKALANEVHRLL